MDDQGAIRLRRVIVHLARQLNASSTGEGLTPSQASVLGLIVGRGPVGLAELASLEGLNPTMLSRVVSKLQDMQLISRTPDPEDLRSATVTVTAAGRQMHDRITAQRVAVVAARVRDLTPQQEETLTAALPALEALADALRLSARPL